MEKSPLEERPAVPCDTVVYKIVEEALYTSEVEPLMKAEGGGTTWDGIDLDKQDGFMHLCTKDTLGPVLAKFYPGRTDVMVMTIDMEPLLLERRNILTEDGPQPVFRFDWVAIPGWMDAWFPHLYVPLPMGLVRAVQPADKLDL